MRRLYTRIYVHFLGVLLVVAIATLVTIALGWRREMAHGMADRFSRHASFLLATTLDDAEERRRVVEHLAELLDADLTLRDRDGNVLEVIGQELPPPRKAVDRHRREGRWRHGHFAAPVRDPVSGEIVGVVQARPWRRSHGFPDLGKHLVGLAGVLLLVGIAVRPLARRISRPVERLTHATRRFGGGDLAYRISVPGCGAGGEPTREVRRRDELGELMRAWNEMAGRIETLVGGHRELLANVSHELRSPLTRMRVALELLPKTPDTEARFAGVEQDIAELERLIDDVLTASRLEAAGLPARPEPIAVESVFDALRERAAHDPLLDGRELRFEHAPGLTITADAALLKRALWNLVENAAKYGAPPIVVAAERAGSRVLLSVRDAGAGVPAGERAQVFAPFHRLDKARTPEAGGRQGFGLGLTIARRVAEAHGGSIHLEGEPANRFVLDLPVAPADRSAAGSE